MIPLSEDGVNWQTELARSVSNVSTLLDATGISSADIPDLDSGVLDFPLRVPLPFIARMEYGNPLDPLLRQVLPLTQEQQTTPGYMADPLDEASANVTPGIIHKYRGRVLFILTGACAINCRYCFRRHFPYQQNQNSRRQWNSALDYVRNDETIEEVIYSGGDPLLNNDKALAKLTAAIETIPHVKRLRIHTRLPVVIPSRIDDSLLAWLGASSLQKVLVLHINHPNELDSSVNRALGRLREANVTLLNQTVLLKSINDNIETLQQLSEDLFNAGVLPYYLHLLDKVQGAAHFDLELSAAQRLAAGLAAKLPGYLVPKLVTETPGASSKTLIMPRP